jgi:glycosyltransferase involved in cell wall biosynthesis
MAADSWESTELEYLPSTGGLDPWRTLVESASDMSRVLWGLAKGQRADLYHLHTSYGASFYRKALLFEALRSTGRPCLIHVHGSRFVDDHEASTMFAATVRRVFLGADTVVCLSRDFERKVLQWTEGAARTAILPNPVSVPEFLCPDRRHDRSPQVVLFMGFIGGRKGCWDLLEAARRVVSIFPDVIFRFGGSGEIGRLEREVRRLGLEHHVEMLGWIRGDARSKAYAEADVFCLPSYRECLPCAILEAMAAGLPVVSTRVAGIPEAVQHERTGLLVEPGAREDLATALLSLLTSADKRRSYGLAGLDLARRQYDVPQVVRQYETLWKSLQR